MKNLFFAELYRAKKSKSPLILLLVCFGLSLMTGAVYGLMFGNVPWLQTMYDEYFGFKLGILEYRSLRFEEEYLPNVDNF